LTSIVADKTLFWIWWFIIIIFGSLFVKGFALSETEYDLKLDDTENSAVANRAVKCFSMENRFGIIDKAKTNNDRLGECFGNKYNMKIDFRVLSPENIPDIEIGDVSGEMETTERFVIVDGGGAMMEVAYSHAS